MSHETGQDGLMEALLRTKGRGWPATLHRARKDRAREDLLVELEDLTPGRVGQVPIELDGDLATDHEAAQSQLIEQLGRVHDIGVTVAGGLRRAGTLAVGDPNSRWLTVADRADEPDVGTGYEPREALRGAFRGVVNGLPTRYAWPGLVGFAWADSITQPLRRRGRR